MDYFDDVFHTFLGLDSVIYLAVNGTVTCKIRKIVFRRRTKILWVWNDMWVINGKIFILGWSNPLIVWKFTEYCIFMTVIIYLFARF